MGGLLICSVFQNLCKEMLLEKAMTLFLTFARASPGTLFYSWLFTEPGRRVVDMVFEAHLDSISQSVVSHLIKYVNN